MKPISQCIFCGKTEDEVVFDKEHVIPKHLHGRLILENTVCKTCNGKFGATVDHQLDGYHEVLVAAQSLGLSDLHEDLIRHRYAVTAKFEDGIELQAQLKVKENQLVIPTQDTSKGYRFYPGDSFIIPLEKNLNRKGKKRHLPKNVISQEIKRVITQLHEAKTSETVDSILLGTSLKKRDDPAKEIKIKVKQKGNALPLVGKIAYEILLLIGEYLFYRTPNLRRQLVSIINGEELKGGVIYRAKAQNPRPSDYHSVRFFALTPESFPYIEITFFGCLVFICFLYTPLHTDYWPKFKNQFLYPDAIGLAYHQGVKDTWMCFSAISADGTHMTLK